jgi:two-component system LytT family response regulator
MRAFEVHAVDYLLKPFSQARFDAALDRARERLREKRPSAAELQQAARGGAPAERLIVRDGTRVHIIPVEKLDYAEAQDDYVCLVSAGKKYLKQQTISSLETCLDAAHFVRVHRSYIVNIERVSKIEPYGKDSRVAILADGTRLPVSRTGFTRLRELLGDQS